MKPLKRFYVIDEENQTSYNSKKGMLRIFHHKAGCVAEAAKLLLTDCVCDGATIAFPLDRLEQLEEALKEIEP